MHPSIILLSWSLISSGLALPTADSNPEAAARQTPHKYDLPLSIGSGLTARKLTKREFKYSLARYTELIYCWFILMKDPSLLEEIQDPEEREEAIWSMCRKWRDVNPYDPAYLLGPRKKRLRWPDGGPWSYQMNPHPSETVQGEAQDQGDEGGQQQQGSPKNEEEEKEGGEGQNRLEFSLPVKNPAGGAKKLGHDVLNRLGYTINHVKAPSTEGFLGKTRAIREPVPIKLPLL